MRSSLLLSLAALLLLPWLPASAETPEDGPFKALSSATTRSELDAAISKARTKGATDQQVIEARLLFGIRTQDNSYIGGLQGEFEASAASFRPSSKSLIGVTTVEQWRSLLAYTRAMEAFENADEDEFKRQITNAFWGFPAQSRLFADAVERFQLRDKMNRWVVDFQTPLLEAGGSETTLASVMGSSKATLLVFWAKSAPASEDVLTVMQKLATHVRGSGIVIAGVNVDVREGEANCQAARKDKSLTIPLLVESSSRQLVQAVEVTSLPRAVLVTQQGRVIFHGHPQEPSLLRAMKRVAPAIRPIE